MTYLSLLGALSDQELIADIASNGISKKIQTKASLKLKDVSMKTENLIRLLKSHDSDGNLKSEISNELKILFEKSELSPDDKIKILQLEGQLINSHRDFNKGTASCFDHSDQAAQYFKL